MWVIKGLWRSSNPHLLAARPRTLPNLGSFSLPPEIDCQGSRCWHLVRVVRCLRLSPQVYPLVDFPLREISLASERGIAQHSATLASRARVLQQVSRVGAWGCWEAGSWGQVRAPRLRAMPSGHIREEMGCSLCWGLFPEKGRKGEGESARGRVAGRSPSLRKSRSPGD